MNFRYRRLPHLHVVGQPHFVTFRLDGSLPCGRFFGRETLTSGEAFTRMDEMLDREVCGPLYLKMPMVAEIVVRAVVGEQGWDLHEWVLMANHVHLLVTPYGGLSDTMRRVKGVSAREANLALGRTGSFWQHESYDRLVRGAEEFRRVARYIQYNPVKAGIAAAPEEFRWSSAYRQGRRRGGAAGRD